MSYIFKSHLVINKPIAQLFIIIIIIIIII